MVVPIHHNSPPLLTTEMGIIHRPMVMQEVLSVVAATVVLDHLLEVRRLKMGPVMGSIPENKMVIRMEKIRTTGIIQKYV